jgi:rhodanese-related sulfurtransferase
MKNVIISLVVLVLVGMFLFVGCQNGESVKSPENDATGEIDSGFRVIDISKGFSDDEIKVNRGEEVKIVYTGKSEGVSISLPEFEIFESSKSNTVETLVKMKQEGEFELITNEKNNEERGIVTVQVFVNETIFINANPEEFEDAMIGEFFLLDVRTKEEYEQSYIEGATLISVYELQERLDEIKQHKDIPVLVYCRSGNRSIVASQVLIDEGFEKVYNLNGGITAWQSYK